MSNAIETLKKVKAVLGLEIKMEQLKLENGTLLEADKFESGESVFIVTEDEKVALPIGSYELEDNRTLVVEEEGIIAKLADHEEEEKVAEEEEEKEEVDAQYVSKEEFSQALEEIKAMIDEVKAGYKKMAEENENLAATREEEKSELQSELSKPAVQPFKHSPEKTAQKEPKVLFAQNRPKSMLDVVFEKLNS